MIKTDKIINTIQTWYWIVVPYDWRPAQIWNRFICFTCRRWTTVKPRTLPYHTWCDRDTLLAHCMFEILDRFLEGECSPGVVNWEATPEHRHAMSEMLALQKWWHEVYLAEIDSTHDEWHEYLKNYPERGKLLFYTADNEAHRLFSLGQIKERQLEEDLTANLKRLIDIKDFMWT